MWIYRSWTDLGDIDLLDQRVLWCSRSQKIFLRREHPRGSQTTDYRRGYSVHPSHDPIRHPAGWIGHFHPLDRDYSDVAC